MKKRRGQLVCQHLENISRAALEEYQDIIREHVRGRRGVYALYRKRKLYYVGLATNLRGRLRHHLKDHHGKSWDRFSVYLTITDQHLRELEALILRIVKPSGNKQKGKFANSEDLRAKFRRAMKASLMAEVNRILSDSRAPRKSRQRTKATGGEEVALAKYSNRPTLLRGTFKGQRVTARVRNDGTIRFAGKNFSSPSSAAIAARKTKTCNGWKFWKYQRAPNDWVPLDTLRK